MIEEQLANRWRDENEFSHKMFLAKRFLKHRNLPVSRQMRSQLPTIVSQLEGDSTTPRQPIQKTDAAKADLDPAGQQAMETLAEAHGRVRLLVRKVLGHR